MTLRPSSMAAIVLLVLCGAAAAAPTAPRQVKADSVFQAALLTPDDLPGYTAQPQQLVAGDDVTGCALFQQALRGSLGDGRFVARTSVQLGVGGPFLDELLFSESAAPSASDLDRYSAQLRGCRELTLGSGVREFELTATAIDFGAGANAIRVDGQSHGVFTVDGYLAIGRVNQSVLIGYLFLQINSASDQQAYAYYVQALTKARRKLGY
jgi:hypothetical protein